MKVLSFDLNEGEMTMMFVIATFMRKVKFDPDGCWIWQGYADKDGYGKWQVAGTKRKVLAHRFAYEWFVGEIPEGLTIDHECEVKMCCNPEHLEPVTNSENVRRYHARREEDREALTEPATAEL